MNESMLPVLMKRLRGWASPGRAIPSERNPGLRRVLATFRLLHRASVMLLGIGLLSAAEPEPQVAAILNELASTANAAQASYDQVLRKADEERQAAMAAARDRAVDGLKRLIAEPRIAAAAPSPAGPGSPPGRPPSADLGDLMVKAEIYAHILRLRPGDAEAARFAKEMGQVSRALERLKPVGDGGRQAIDLGEWTDEMPILSIWNQFNSHHRDRGSDQVQVRLFSGRQAVHEVGPKAVPWIAGSDTRLDIPLPRHLVFDRVRIEVLSWHGEGGGLGEIQLLHHGVNRLATWRPSASEIYNEDFDANRVVDGILSSREFAQGYWLLPNAMAGWIELGTEQQPVGGYSGF